MKKTDEAVMELAEVEQARSEPVSTEVAISPQTQMMSVIEKAALDPNVDVDKMERLLAIQEKLFASRAKQEFDVAMAGFREDCPAIERTRTILNKDRSVKARYAPLEDVVKVIKPHLMTWGLNYRFRNIPEDNGNQRVECIVTHVGGHEATSQFLAPPDQNKYRNAIQDLGSSLSYARRYSLQDAFGLVLTDEDTDGDAKRSEAIDTIGAYMFQDGTDDGQVTSTIVAILADKLPGYWKDLPLTILERAAQEDGWKTLFPKTKIFEEEAE